MEKEAKRADRRGEGNGLTSLTPLASLLSLPSFSSR